VVDIQSYNYGNGETSERIKIGLNPPLPPPWIFFFLHESYILDKWRRSYTFHFT